MNCHCADRATNLLRPVHDDIVRPHSRQVRAQRRFPLGRPQVAELLGLSGGSSGGKGGDAAAVTNGVEQLTLQSAAVR